MKIVFFDLALDKQAFFKEAFPGAELIFFEEALNRDSVSKAKEADIVSVFVKSAIDQEVIDAMPELKLITTRSTGFDHIDCAYAEKKGIKVASVPGYGSHTVAEFAFGLILNLSRKILSANNYLKQSMDFDHTPIMEGFDLVGKTIGVVGTGRIGKNVVKIARGFGMEVLVCDPYPDHDFASEQNCIYEEFDKIISSADIITLHVPYTEANHHLINKKNIATLKKGAWLINTARGELIDTEALVQGLKNKTIGGAGLDVLEDERGLRNNPTGTDKIVQLNRDLIAMPNVIVTPHIAFYTAEAVAEILEITRKNIQDFIAGSPANLVK